MKIINKTRPGIFLKNVGYANKYHSRLRGLMLSKPGNLVIEVKKEGILESSIHMMFMLYPIKVVWVNKEYQVVDILDKANPFNPFKPSSWRFYKSRYPAKFVFEIGLGEFPVEVGDTLEFQFDSSKE